MSTPLPGQIRCPTCHRSTPPAAFCTQCGTSIPLSARARPRGLDREELQERIRTHRPDDAAFRRGSPLGEGYGQEDSRYQPYRPEPEDDLILSETDAGEPGAARVDHTPPGFDDEPLPPVDEARRSPEPQPAPWKPAPATTPETKGVEPPAPQWSAPQEPDDAAEAYDDRYRAPDDDWGRRGSGMSPLAIGGFVLLGVLAIGVGAFVAGIFSGGVAVASPTPTLTVAPTATPEPSLEPTAGASVPASSTASNGSPVPFPDGFTARAEPCAEEPSSQDGCGSSGASVSGGSVWVWVGFRKGTSADVVGVTILDASGASVGDGSKELGSIGCGDSCSGWIRLHFSSLSPGNYGIRVDRNGLPAAEASFTVTS